MTTLTRYLEGLVLSGVAVGPLALAAVRLRARILPDASGAFARVTEVVLIAGLLVITLQIIGVMGAFDRLGAVLGCVIIGLAGTVAGSTGRRAVRRTAPPAPATPRPLAPRLVAVAAVAVVSASWVGWSFYAYRHGMQTVDTLWYHLPTAARFVQTSSILHLQYFDAQPVTVFYPANAELFHAFGLLMFGSDLASPAINLGWAALALLAAWAIGARYGRGPESLILLSIVLATPALVDTQPGGGYNDIVCIALLLSAAAILVCGNASLPSSALAAVAAGLALGTKFTMIAPAIALGVGAVAIARRGGRARQAGVWIAGLAVLGGYWYLRNAVLVGNPVPSLRVSVGPLSLPAPAVGTPSFTVAQYLGNLHIWRTFYVPGLRRALGPAWWAIIVLSVAGAIGAVLRSELVIRMLGAVTLLSFVVFLFTPQFLGLPGVPIYFVFNVRYVEPAVALGLVLLPVQGVFASSRPARALLAVASACLVATELDPGVWPTGIGLTPFATPLQGSSAIVGAAVGAGVVAIGWAWLAAERLDWGWAVRLERAGGAGRARRGARLGVMAGLAVALLGGWGLASSYAARRYRNSPPMPEIYRWARSVSGVRIGIVGFTQQYPLYGPRDSNYVQYVGASAPHRGFALITTCQAWRRAVNAGRYQWLVIAPSGFPFGRSVGAQVGWTSSSGAAQVVISERAGTGFEQNVVLLHVTGVLNPSTCPRAADLPSTPSSA